MSVSSQNLFILSEQQITSVEEVTYMIIYSDLKTIPLHWKDSAIAEILKQLDERLIPDTFPAHTFIIESLGKHS